MTTNRKNMTHLIASNNDILIETLIKISDEIYAINSKNVIEIIKLVELNYPDSLNYAIIGLLNYKEEILSVVDLKEIFKKQEKRYDTNSKIIVVHNNDKKFAIICDDVFDIQKINKTEIKTPPKEVGSDFFEGIIENSEKLLLA